jgi:predicted transcriptional regulator
MSDLERFVPVGEDSAAPAAEIWRHYDLGARTTVRSKLNRLTAEGRIMRKSRPMPNGNEVYLYYRAAE